MLARFINSVLETMVGLCNNENDQHHLRLWDHTNLCRTRPASSDKFFAACPYGAGGKTAFTQELSGRASSSTRYHRVSSQIAPCRRGKKSAQRGAGLMLSTRDQCKGELPGGAQGCARSALLRQKQMICSLQEL